MRTTRSGDRRRSRLAETPFEQLEQRLACTVLTALKSPLTAAPLVVPTAAVVSAAVAPGPVTKLAAVRGDRQVSLSWTPPAATGGSAIQQYVVDVKVLTAGKWSGWQRAATPVSAAAVITGLTNGRQHSFRVAAVNAIGTGAFTALAASVTPIGLPQQPTGLAATAGTGGVTLRWTAPVDTGGSSITNYRIQARQDVGGSWGAWADVPRSASTATTASIGSLTNGLAYQFQVRAVNAAGAGAWTASPVTTQPTYFRTGLVPPSGWVHRNGFYSSYYVPDAKWQAVDSSHGINISSPTGVIGVGLSFGATGFASTPLQALQNDLGQAGLVSYSITRAGTLVSSGGVQKQEFEATGVFQGPNGQFAVRGVFQYTTFYDPSAGYGFMGYSMSARSDLFAGALDTMQVMRCNIRRMR